MKYLCTFLPLHLALEKYGWDGCQDDDIILGRYWKHFSFHWKRQVAFYLHWLLYDAGYWNEFVTNCKGADPSIRTFSHSRFVSSHLPIQNANLGCWIQYSYFSTVKLSKVLITCEKWFKDSITIIWWLSSVEIKINFLSQRKTIWKTLYLSLVYSQCPRDVNVKYFLFLGLCSKIVMKNDSTGEHLYRGLSSLSLVGFTIDKRCLAGWPRI